MIKNIFNHWQWDIRVFLIFLIPMVIFVMVFSSGVPTKALEATPGTRATTGQALGVGDDSLNINYMIDERDSSLRNAWETILGITNMIVLILLLVVGFSTIFRLQIDTYHIKKAIIPIILGIILANFSLVICRTFLDFSNILTVSLVNDAGGLSNMSLKVRDLVFPDLSQVAKSGNKLDWELAILPILVYMGWLGIASGAGFLVLLGGLILFFVWVFIPAIFFLILGFLFYIRNWMLIFLIALSPIAFLFVSFSPVQSLFKKWWDQFIKWTFMVPVSFFFLWIAVKLGSGEMIVVAEGGSTMRGPGLGDYLLGAAMLFLAISAPLTMGGAVMKLWSGWGKKAAALAGAWGWKKGNVQLEKATWSKTGQAWNRSPIGKLLPFTSYRSWFAGYKGQIEEMETRYAKQPEAMARARTQTALGAGVWRLFSPKGRKAARQEMDQRQEEIYGRMVAEEYEKKRGGLVGMNKDSLQSLYNQAVDKGDAHNAEIYLQGMLEKGDYSTEEIFGAKEKLYQAGQNGRNRITPEMAKVIDSRTAEKKRHQDQLYMRNRDPRAWVTYTDEAGGPRNQESFTKEAINQLSRGASPENLDRMTEQLNDMARYELAEKFGESVSSGGGVVGGGRDPLQAGQFVQLRAEDYLRQSSDQNKIDLMTHSASVKHSQGMLGRAEEDPGFKALYKHLTKKPDIQLGDIGEMVAKIGSGELKITDQMLAGFSQTGFGSSDEDKKRLKSAIEQVKVNSANVKNFDRIGQIAEEALRAKHHEIAVKDLSFSNYSPSNWGGLQAAMQEVSESMRLEPKALRADQLIKISQKLHFSDEAIEIGSKDVNEIREHLRERSRRIQLRLQEIARQPGAPTIQINKILKLKLNFEPDFKMNPREKELLDKWRENPPEADGLTD